jgi:hypothetical protein
MGGGGGWQRLGTGDEDRFGAGGLITATPSGWRHADEFCGRGSAVGGGRGELILNDRFDIVDANEHILRFEICALS